MSIPISPELEAAQGAAMREYGWRVVVGDCPCEVPRFDWSEIYDTGESQQFSAMALNGTIYRARASWAGYVLIDDVADPAGDAEWAAEWRWNLGQVARNDSPICVAYLDRLGVGLCPVVFYLRRADGAIVARWLDASTMTWGSEIVVYDVASGVSPRSHHRTAMVSGAGVKGLHLDPAGGAGRWLMALLDRGGPSGGDGDPIVVEYDAATDSWLPAVEMVWGHYEAEGIASALDGEHVRFWFKGGLGGGHLYYGSYRTTDGTWSPTCIVAPGENGFYNYRPTAGYIAAPDWIGRRWYLVWREYCASPSIDRQVIGFSPNPGYLGERMPAPIPSRQGPAQLLLVGDHWYLLGSHCAHRGKAWTGSTAQKVEVSARVVYVEEDYPAPNRPGRLTLLLDNSDGRLAGVGQVGGPFRALREGSQVALGLGVRAGGALLYAWRSPWYVERFTFEEERGTAHLRVECTDPLGVLHQLRSTAQPSWTGATAREVLWSALYRVTGAQLGPAGALDTSVGWLAIRPGTDWGELVEELLRWAGVMVRWRTSDQAVDGVGPGVVEVAAVGLAEGESVRGFGGSGQAPIVAAAFGVLRSPGINRVQVFGQGSRHGEWRDEAHQLEQGRDLVRVVHDHKLIGDGDCATAAQQRLRWAQLEGEGGWLEVYPDFALEVGDVVGVTHPRAGLVDREYRVVGMRTVFDTRRGEYRQRLRLGKKC